MADTTTIAALLAIWDELPTLAGDQWPTLEPQLKKLLGDFETATDSAWQDQISFNIQVALETVPAVRDRFDDVFVEMGQNTRSVRGDLSTQIGRLQGRTARLTKTFTRYTDISCPRRVWVGTKRVSVVVRLTIQPSRYSDVTEQVLVTNEAPVRVHINAPAFEVLGPSEQETTIEADADSPPLVFDLCPRQVGDTHLTFDFLQGGNLVGIATVMIEVTASEISEVNELQAGPLLRSGIGVEPPDFTLYITYERSLNPLRLSFELRSALDPGQRFPAIDLRVRPEVYAANIYQRLTMLTNSYDPTVHAVLGQDRALSPEDAEELLKEEGQSCRLTHKSAKTGRYASEEENGEDMCQISTIGSFKPARRG